VKAGAAGWMVPTVDADGSAEPQRGLLGALGSEIRLIGPRSVSGAPHRSAPFPWLEIPCPGSARSWSPPCWRTWSEPPIRERARFDGLRYFPPNPQLQLQLLVEPADGSTLEIATSDGSTRRFRRCGGVRFEIDGEQAELVLLSRQDEHGFFVPFRDATSGKESCGAGRYLDVEPGRDGRVQLDFNLAYNPDCAYNEAFSCPLPPPENWLRVPVRAGEAAYTSAS
jgi:hypothetical protein